MNTQERIERIESDLAIVKKEIAEKKEFNVGDWVVTGKRIGCITKKEGDRVYLYGVKHSTGTWMYDDWVVDSYINRLATEEEVKESLVKEAKKRGFKEGVRIKEHADGDVGDISLSIDDDDFVFLKQENQIEMDCAIIFDNGKWAEIIDEVPEYTMTELIKKVGHDFVIKE